MTGKLILISLVLSCFMISCEKNETGNIENNGIPLLSQVYFDTTLVYEYKYNSANLISEEKSKLHYTKHNYDKNNQLISTDFYLDPGMYSSNWSVVEASHNRKEWVNPENTEKNSSRAYLYDISKRLIKTSEYLGYTLYSFDNNNRIICQTFYHEQKKSGYIDYTYDEKGNIIKREHYFVLDSGECELETTTLYEFDNKHNPYKAFGSLMIPGRNTNSNNITKEIYTLHFEVDNTIEKVQVTENSYEYNEKGYPVRQNGTIEYRY